MQHTQLGSHGQNLISRTHGSSGHLEKIPAENNENFTKKCGISKIICDIPEHYDPIETGRLTYLDLTFDKLNLLPSNLELPKMEIKIRKNYLRLPNDSIASGAMPL